MKDFDEDGVKESLIPYTSDGIPYLGIVKVEGNKSILLDSFKGDGYTVREMFVKQIGSRQLIFVGFELGGSVRKLEILTYKCKRLTRAYGKNNLLYSKMNIKELGNDGNKQLILWLHDSGEKYTVDIYLLKDSELKKTTKYDRNYIEEMANYYSR